MLVNDLANYIRTLNLVPAEFPIQVAYLDASTPSGIMVMTPLTGILGNPSIPGYYRGNIQIVVRHPNPMEGGALAMELMESMTILSQEVALENYTVKQFRPYGLPIMYPRNEAGLFEHSVTFDCAVQRG